MTAGEKEFVLTHVFKNISSMKHEEEQFSPTEEHFGVPWRISVYRDFDYFGLWLYCDQDKNGEEWSIEVWKEAKLKAANGKTCSEENKNVYKGTDDDYFWGWLQFIKWEDMMRHYAMDNTLKVEIRVKIRKMTGLETMKKNLMSFDESTVKFSDVVLIVGNRKFYVSKLSLARHSNYFETLLLGNFKEFGKSEVTLHDINPDDFQNYLEVLHGEPAIDDQSVEGILKLAEMYDSLVCVKRCEQFLIEKSQKSMVSKFGISIRFKLENLKEKCIGDINGINDLKSFVESNMDQMDFESAMFVLRKFVSL